MRAFKQSKVRAEIRPEDIILPYFVVGGKGIKKPIKSMPGVFHFSIDTLLKDMEEAPYIRSVLLFGLAETKDESGSDAYRKDGVIQKAIRAIKKEFSARGGSAFGGKDLTVITDVCLCGYTTHGHCRILKSTQSAVHSPRKKSKSRKPWTVDGGLTIDNDATLKTLVKIALSHADAGADLVAPSAMMDKQVKVIRGSLDKNGFKSVRILGYSAKYASNFYGPFRDVLDSEPKFGDRSGYQLGFDDPREALEEIKKDIEEGSDIVMVKPALAYLDIIYRAKQKFNIPIAAYNVSGEYAMVKRYIESTVHGPQSTDIEKKLILEILTAIKRAGADLIITYFGKEVGRWLDWEYKKSYLGKQKNIYQAV